MEELILPIIGVALGVAGILAVRREASKLDRDKDGIGCDKRSPPPGRDPVCTQPRSIHAPRPGMDRRNRTWQQIG